MTHLLVFASGVIVGAFAAWAWDDLHREDDDQRDLLDRAMPLSFQRPVRPWGASP